MKTTIDLPEALLHRAKVTAAQRKTTLRDLVATGLDWVIRSSDIPKEKSAALDRLRAGLHLGGEPLTREEAHEPR
jgi:hypothetical protein